MEFIDHTGHIFSLPTFDDNPIASKYNESDYIFWIKDNPVSIDNYYILPIRFLLDYDEYITDINDAIFSEDLSIEEALKINISIESNFYKLIGPKYIQEKLELCNDINKPIQFSLEDFKSELNLEDFYYDYTNKLNENLIVYNDNKKFLLFPFYVIGTSHDEGTYLSNIMIKIDRIKKNSKKVPKVLNRDEMYDLIMKKTMTDINIYECDNNGENKQLWYTIKAGYDSSVNEILYPYVDPNHHLNLTTSHNGHTFEVTDIVYSSLDPIRENQMYRIRNFGDRNLIPEDVFHWICRLPEDKYLDLAKYYIFEGKFFNTCNYCGGIFGFNHDGSKFEDFYHYEPDTGIEDSYKQADNSLSDNKNNKKYKDDWLEDKFWVPNNNIDPPPGPPPPPPLDEEDPNKNEGDEEGEWNFTNEEKIILNDIFNQNQYIITEEEEEDESDGHWSITYICNKKYPYMFKHRFGQPENHGESFKIDDTIVFGGFIHQEDIETREHLRYVRDIFFDIDNIELTKTDGGVIYYYETSSEYTQITVGCTFIDETEELIINGNNMGIRLPKDIIKAIYNSSFYHKYADEKIFKDKMKELLLNYMNIKGECGNFKSVINSLKWFGWGDKIEISKLIKTDNEFQNQYILDYFNITTDLKETYKYFNTTNLIALSVKGNQETNENYLQNFSQCLIGEGKPILEDLFEKNVEVTYDDISFYKPYYDFLFNELALKLDCLSYYYQKYFLPIHLKINRASIEYKVYANTLKLTCTGFQRIVEDPIILHNSLNQDNINVIFPNTNQLLYYKSIHYIDSKFNEFSNYNDNFEDEDLYYVNENCICLPITIENQNNQYIENGYGEYLLIDDEYIKPYRFYEYDDNRRILTETNEYSKAKYAKLYYSSEDYINLSKYSRYSKISEGYYNCKLFLSYIDNDSNEEKYLVKNNTFNFYQSTHQYYSNYIIIPRLIKDKSFDWLNTQFRLTLVINNKWFTYDFTIHIPNIYLDLGVLKYKYYIKDNTTMFNQFKFKNNKLTFNSFIYQPDLVTIDTLFYDKDKDRVLSFIDKLIETEGNQNKIYDFYKKYYMNQINVPYNKKYYNKVHIFDIKISGKGYTKIIMTENFDWEVWESEWSEYNGGINNVIKSWSGLVLDFFNEYPNSVIKFYRNDGEVLEANNTNLNTRDMWQTLIINNGFGDAENISHIEFVDAEGTIIYDLMYIKDKLIFDELKKVNGSNDHVNHKHVKNWWYDNLRTNETQISNEYTGEENINDLYSKLFNLNTSDLLFNIDESCEYDAYLMHDPILEGKQAYWYLVLISKLPICDYNEENLKIHKEIYKIDNSTEIKYSGYSFDKFLVDRMDIVNSNGYNHFNQDDLIIATVNNNNYQFNIDLSSKWVINKVYDEDNSTEVTSLTNTIIIPNNNFDNLYSPGYYNIRLNYTINGLNDQYYFSQGKYLVTNINENIKYPVNREIEVETIEIPFFTNITDFKIMYESTSDNKKIFTTDILGPEEGYVPVGIKIVNAGYFATNSPAIYMGLKQLSITNPDYGFGETGYQPSGDIPHFGFYGIHIDGLKEFNIICYKDESHTNGFNLIYPQHDVLDKLPKDDDGNLLYPAPNGRGFAGSSDSYFNLLNDDDTYNMNFIDENCAASDWDGKYNTEIMINNFDIDPNNSGPYANWKTLEDLQSINHTDRRFSPMCACAWRYHTLTTNQGDWYIPAYANVFFLSYNFKRYSDLFEQLNSLYPEYCKSDLLSSISGNALWTTTVCNDTHNWEIHPCNHAHPLSRTTDWQSIPFISINEETGIPIHNSEEYRNPNTNSDSDNNRDILLWLKNDYEININFNGQNIVLRINFNTSENELLTEIEQTCQITWVSNSNDSYIKADSLSQYIRPEYDSEIKQVINHPYMIERWKADQIGGRIQIYDNQYGFGRITIEDYSLYRYEDEPNITHWVGHIKFHNEITTNNEGLSEGERLNFEGQSIL